MHHAINHVHLRSNDPNASAAWYTEHFGAKVLSSREVMPGTITITMDTGSPVRLNISSQRAGESQEHAVPEINRLGLEHYGFDTDDIEADIAHFDDAGVRIVMPITDVGSGSKIAYIEGPDDVVIELVQRGS
ncbi:MAG: VOC family protein [Dehalococcoidia bacterium]|nr:VOC family protein [Dehalococcoidia bacterium]